MWKQKEKWTQRKKTPAIDGGVHSSRWIGREKKKTGARDRIVAGSRKRLILKREGLASIYKNKYIHIK
jgi:hypothetical protein